MILTIFKSGGKCVHIVVQPVSNSFHLVKLKLYTHEITPAPFPEHLETTIELSVSTNLTTLETHRSGTIQRFFVTGLFHLA